jgi:O-antigen ligase
MLRRIVWVLLLAGTILAAVPLYQQVTNNFDNEFGGFGQTSERGFRTGEEDLFGDVRQPRLAGAIGEQNRFAQVLLMLVPLGLLRFWGRGHENSKALRLLALLATAVITAGVLLTFSRGAAVGLLIMVIVMVFMRLIKVYHLGAVLLVAVVLLVMLPQYGTRLASLATLPSFFSPEENVDDGVFESRTTEMVAAILVFADHPLVGVGPGMFKYYSAEYGNQVNPGVLEGTREAHNLYLGVAADHGFLGLLSFISIIAVTFYQLLRNRAWLTRNRPELANLVNAFALAVVTYLATGLFLHLSYARYFWLMMALAGAAGAIARKSAETKNSETNRLFVPYGQPAVLTSEGVTQ